ncbi:MAG: hypothetical protein K0R13_3173, partial [Propionibacteriaceae bacterium]|nr:hypothetical protein [Propionibacteriaceae bacterium]
EVPVPELLSLLSEVLLSMVLDLLVRPHVGRCRVDSGLDCRTQGVYVEHAHQVHGHTEISSQRGCHRYRLLGQVRAV